MSPAQVKEPPGGRRSHAIAAAPKTPLPPRYKVPPVRIPAGEGAPSAGPPAKPPCPGPLGGQPGPVPGRCPARAPPRANAPPPPPSPALFTQVPPPAPPAGGGPALPGPFAAKKPPPEFRPPGMPMAKEPTTGRVMRGLVECLRRCQCTTSRLPQALPQLHRPGRRGRRRRQRRPLHLSSRPLRVPGRGQSIRAQPKTLGLIQVSTVRYSRLL